MTRQILLDTETTGLEAHKGHRIIEIGCLEMVSRRLTGRKFHTYLNPEREVDPGASAVSGITTESLLDKPKFHEVADEFLAFIEDAELIIHNAPFDISFINAELAILQHPWKTVDSYVRIFDTLALARQLHPGQKNNLDALCKRYGVDNTHRTFHGALLDAEILARVYLAMTAGQTHFSLGAESPLQVTTQDKQQQKIKLKRNKSLQLTVIRANDEENGAHEKRLVQLQK
jgi:DNA polymerase-3 subunit epsilon